MKLRITESAIGLFAYPRKEPLARFYQQFYSFICARLAQLHVDPTYFGVVGENYTRGLTRFGGRRHRSVLNANFENISALSLIANPAGSNKPAYDNFFDCGIGCVRTGFPQSEEKEVYLRFVLNESLLPFASRQFEQLLEDLIDLYPWDFGMGFSDTVERHPEFYISCLGHQNLLSEERDDFQAWYSTPPEIRLVKLRSVFSYNIVNEQQLSQEVDRGMSLREFIEEGSLGVLEALPDGRLHLWKVPDPTQRRALRTYLKERGLVVDDATTIQT